MGDDDAPRCHTAKLLRLLTTEKRLPESDCRVIAARRRLKCEGCEHYTGYDCGKAPCGTCAFPNWLQQARPGQCPVGLW